MAKQKEGTKSVNAIDLLEQQHREVEKLFEEYESAASEDDCVRLFETIADKLAVHATIEEKVFYPACVAAQTKDILLESVEEHLQIKRVLADLLAMDHEDEEKFDAAMKVLKEEVEHHVGEERGNMFPKVRKLLDEETLLALAGEMMTMQAELEDKGAPREAIPSETAEPAPIG